MKILYIYFNQAYELYTEVGDDGYAVLIKNTNKESPFRMVI